MDEIVKVAVPVSVGLLLLLVVLQIVFYRIRRRLARLVDYRYDRQEIIRATTRANFFGIKSKGGAQIVGNGALVLTRSELCFIRAVPHKAYQIPIPDIRKVSQPKIFNGKSAFVPLLCVHFFSGSEVEQIAWALPDTRQWRDAINHMIV